MLKKKESRNIKFIELLAPFFDETLVKIFQQYLERRKEFFKKTFNLNIKPCPIICVVANLYEYKNHEILIKAMHELIKKHNIEVQAVFAGSGFAKRIEELSAVANKLEIKEYVNFLGFTDKIPELLFFSDMQSFTKQKGSVWYSFNGSCINEVPYNFVSRGRFPADYIIQHEKTGLLFDVDNEIDLAMQIKRLLDDKKFADLLAQNAYDFVSENCTIDVSLSRLISLYKKIYKIVQNRRKVFLEKVFIKDKKIK